ncbi:MAG: hypothetical protein SOY70_04430 [Veillonellaceae bacterium]|nr:hypothetical protein [Veillonellaceae bacterium]
MFVFAGLLGLQMVSGNNSAFAKDYWVYTADDGTTYWTDSKTVCAGGGQAAGLLKAVKNNKVISKKNWWFRSDEGYVWACESGNHDAFVIYQAPRHVGYVSAVYNRPELLAFERWLVANCGFHGMK